MFCIYPRLWAVPHGEWACPLCNEVREREREGERERERGRVREGERGGERGGEREEERERESERAREGERERERGREGERESEREGKRRSTPHYIHSALDTTPALSYTMYNELNKVCGDRTIRGRVSGLFDGRER